MLNGRMGEVGLSAVPLDLLDLFVSDVCRGAGFRRVCIVAKIASSCPSVRLLRVCQYGSHWTDLREIWNRGCL